MPKNRLRVSKTADNRQFFTVITLKAKDIPRVGLELEINPEGVSGKTLEEVRKMPVFVGNKEGKLNDFFKIEGSISKDPGKQKLVFDCDLSNVKRIGQGMSTGEIVIRGNVGLHLGENMSGGKIILEGNADGWIGTGMKGGEIVIKGNAGSYVGCAERGRMSGMTSGSIVVEGNAEHYIGVGLSGGKITVKGSAGQFVGSYMKEGIIEVKNIGLRPGYAMSGGKIIVENVEVPFYFFQFQEDGKYKIYEGDQSFEGKGQLCVKK